MTFVDRRCFTATCRDHQRSLTCLWDVDAAMFNAKAGRSLGNTRANKNQPSSTIARYMDRHSRVNYRVSALNKNPANGTQQQLTCSESKPTSFFISVGYMVYGDIN